MGEQTREAPVRRDAIQELANALQVLVLSLAASERDTLDHCEHCETLRAASHRVLTAANEVRSALSALANVASEL
ncbi:MAG: hypothetical protein A3H97_15225 [Acidobacteria bacterium RIFCSPLOWO2_02_FULL_65_29]|nr:MAG: hypothetical protein A3H97_15225 [Acidobacteria bacterium RIFCSPLOWO2_02_FULL_65_29]